MKKIFFSMTVLLLSLISISCASVPKKMKKGDSMVIGKVDVEAVNYPVSVGDVNFNGHYMEGNEIIIRNIKTGKEKSITTDKDGYFYVSGLIPHDTYEITTLKVTHYENSGSGITVTTEFSSPRQFVVYDNIVVNLGATFYTLDGSTNMTSWEITSYYLVKQYFQEIAAESEWLNAEIIDSRQ